MKVKDILAKKGESIYTILEEKTVYDAISELVKHGIGALLVLNQDKSLVGIISERDILRVCHKHADKLKSLQVKEVMTKELIVSTLEEDIENVEYVMTDNRIRHLPIMSGTELAGVISIGDIVKNKLTVTTVENLYLRDYIQGKYPG